MSVLLISKILLFFQTELLVNDFDNYAIRLH